MNKLLSIVSGVVVGMTVASSAIAGSYPSKPITLWVGYGAGGTTDTSMRVLAELLEKDLGVSVNVKNKGGGGGAVLTGLAKTWKKDGYNIFTYLTGATSITPHMRNVPYHPLNDFDLISQVASWNVGIVARSDAPYGTFKEFIEYAKNNPGKIKYGTSGAGTPQDLTMRRIAQVENINWKHVPFKGGAKAVAALLGGHVDVMPGSAEWIEHVKSGELKPLAVFTSKRLDQFPDLPLISEMGYTFEAPSWLGLAAPKGVPAEVITTLEQALKRATAQPEFKSIISKLIMQVNYRNSKDFTNNVQINYDAMGKVIQQAGLSQK